MAPISVILRQLLLSASMIVMASSSSVELPEAPSGSGHRFQLIRLSLRYSDHEYVMQLPIGNSWLSGFADTGSDLIWTNNSQLIHNAASCPAGNTVDYKQDCCLGLPTFTRKYGGSTVVKGFMGNAKLTLEGSSYALTIGSAVVLGDCQHLPANGQDNGCPTAYRAGGIVGLGSGKGSLVTQLRLDNFSYCLAEGNSFIELNGSSSVVALPKDTTTLAQPTNGDYSLASRYFVRPKEIVLGKAKDIPQTVTKIPHACPKEYNKNGDGVMAIDSGHSFTVLPREVLHDVTNHVNKLMNKEPKTNSHNKRFICYDVNDVKNLPKDMPDMVLHFCDEAQMVIPVDNYMYLDEEEKEYCLVFEKALGMHPQMSILGNFQQRNMRMLFDIKRKTLSFIKHKCGQAQEEEHAAV